MIELFETATIFVWIFAIVIGVMLFISPIMIWLNCRRSANALENIEMKLSAIMKFMPASEEALALEIREVANVLKSATE